MIHVALSTIIKGTYSYLNYLDGWVPLKLKEPHFIMMNFDTKNIETMVYKISRHKFKSTTYILKLIANQ
jgi:hypothetical protein